MNGITVTATGTISDTLCPCHVYSCISVVIDRLCACNLWVELWYWRVRNVLFSFIFTHSQTLCFAQLILALY